jgi:hypothetical protein
MPISISSLASASVPLHQWILEGLVSFACSSTHLSSGVAIDVTPFIIEDLIAVQTDV